MIQEEPGSAGASQEIADVAGPGDSLFSVLCANLIEETTARRIAADMASVVAESWDQGKDFNAYTQLKPEETRYTILTDHAGNFQKVTLEMDPAHVYHSVPRGNNTIHSWKEDVVVDFRVEAIAFKVQGTLAESVLNAGEGSMLATKLTNVFRWDIDFQSESRRGDVCKVLVQRRFADDRPLGYGDVLAAVYEGKKVEGGKKTAILFNGQYYDDRGVELKKDFLRSPLRVLRLTSKYGQRFHPVLGQMRHHDGVDYGAPTGTRVQSIARGVVTTAGWHGGYGNYVCVKHDSGIESRYGHLSRMFVKKGQRIQQCQCVGLVGQTGIATGPHLHFELLNGGKHDDPLSPKNKRKYRVELRQVASPLSARFDQVRKERLTSLASAAPPLSSPKGQGLASAR
ncbi:MAG: M23 family metallopeptidase [Desulfomonile tiedjei]|nr:M23 family metallopeptidase [Desulfomonile tiedjei]